MYGGDTDVVEDVMLKKPENIEQGNTLDSSK